jgi:hypothetical protein
MQPTASKAAQIRTAQLRRRTQNLLMPEFDAGWSRYVIRIYAIFPTPVPW